MSGNVWEWVQDYGVPYSSGAVQNPYFSSGSIRRLRSGGWDVDANHVRSANRSDAGYPDFSAPYIGFRVARTVP